MVLAGHETTVNLLGNGLLTLLRHPDQLERLRQNPGLTRSAVDEMLRFESPLQRGTYRITRAPYEVCGVTLEVGQQVSAVIGSANRDADEFPQPDVFDIERNPNRHLAFGKGIHKCLGERLARAEARIAFCRLIERFSDIRLLDESPQWQDKTLFRGLKSLRVSFLP
jgi:cytochrome P450